jgi:PKD repeat protein
MTKRLLLFFAIVFFCLEGRSQWTTTNVGTTRKLYSVDYYSASELWVGAYNSFAKTTDGGAHWSVSSMYVPAIGDTLIGSPITNIATTGSGRTLAAGLIFGGDPEAILLTTNAGSTWSWAWNTSSSPVTPKTMYAFDFSGSRGVAAGNGGRTLITSNAGASWTLLNTGSSIDYFKYVKFISYDTVMVIAQQKTMRSVNGGYNYYITQWYNYTFNQAGIAHETIYLPTVNANLLYKSTNYMVSHSTINLPFTATGVIYAVTRDTVIAAATTGLYVSTTGGQYWEKYININAQNVNMIDALNSTTVAIVQDSGFIMMTSNLANCPSLPLTGFTVAGSPSLYCQGDSINLNNTTAPLPGYIYDWRLDGVTFSSQYNAGVRLTTAGAHTITLRVTNSFGTDSTSLQINVVGHTVITVPLTAAADTVCSGFPPLFYVTNSTTGVSYQLRKGFTNIGTAQNGNGGTLTFSGTTMTADTVFNIKVVTTNVCFTDSGIAYKTIRVCTAPLVTVPGCALNSASCTDRGIINVTLPGINNNSSFGTNYTNYSCFLHSDLVVGQSYPLSVRVNVDAVIDVYMDFNNDGSYSANERVAYGNSSGGYLNTTITIPSSVGVYDHYVRMRVQANNLANQTGCFTTPICGESEDYAVKVGSVAAPPVPSFTYTSAVSCSTTVNFTSTSFNAASYLWNFGDGSPLDSTLNPSHIYTVSGTYTITLTACNAYGCDTAIQAIAVTIAPFPQPFLCTSYVYPSYVGSISTFEVDTTAAQSNFWNWQNPGYGDHTCSQPLHVTAGRTYYAKFTSGSNRSASMHIDYNNNGYFDGSSEYVNFNGGWPVYQIYTTYYFIPFTIKEPAVPDTAVRFRLLVWDGGYNYNFPNACGTIHGAFADFTMIIDCADPTVQASNITFTNVTYNSMKVNWTNGNGTRRIVRMNTSNNFNAPVNAVDYVSNPVYLGGEQTVYNGTANNVIVTGLAPHHMYWFRVYEAGCSAGNSHYLASAASNNPGHKITAAASPNNSPNRPEEELEEQTGNFNLFPNPNNGSFIIQPAETGKQYFVEVFNMLGEKIYSAALKEEDIYLNAVAGIYFVRVSDGKNVFTQKLVIE